MDDQTLTLPENAPPSLLVDDHSTVDTSCPFRSVKEAVAIFGEHFLAPEIHSPSPKPTFSLPKQTTPVRKSTPDANQTMSKTTESEQDPSQVVMITTVKKLEAELEETKRELNILKERGSETEVALASLNAELHMTMSKIAKAEAEAAGKAVAMRSSMTLRQVLAGGGDGGGVGEIEKGTYLINEKKVMKKKPVVPLVMDLLFTRKNGKAKNSLMNPLYTSPQMYRN